MTVSIQRGTWVASNDGSEEVQGRLVALVGELSADAKAMGVSINWASICVEVDVEFETNISHWTSSPDRAAITMRVEGERETK